MVVLISTWLWRTLGHEPRITSIQIVIFYQIRFMCLILMIIFHSETEKVISARLGWATDNTCQYPACLKALLPQSMPNM